MPSLFPPIKAGASRELAGKLELDPAALEETVTEFNAAVRPGTFDHTMLDDCRTEGLDAAEDPLGAADRDARPIYAYPVRPGITFTYLGTRVNKQARMLMEDGKPGGQHVRRRRDHGRQRARQGLCRRHRHDDRQRLRTDRGTGGRAQASMHGNYTTFSRKPTA